MKTNQNHKWTGKSVRISYRPNGGEWLWAGNGTVSTSGCVEDCAADLPQDVYDSIDEGVMRGVDQDVIQYLDSVTDYRYVVEAG